MKNIKSALQDRLDAVAKKIDFEKQRHEDVMKRLLAAHATIEAMIAIEDAENEPQSDMFTPTSAPQQVATADQLEAGILAALKAHNARMLHGDVKEFLVRKGLGSATDPQFGRRIQGTLLSLKHRGIVDQPAMATWSLASQKAGAT